MEAKKPKKTLKENKGSDDVKEIYIPSFGLELPSVSKNRGGKPEHIPTQTTRDAVQYLAALGLPHEQIARSVGLVCDKTLRSKYREELDLGKAQANAKVLTYLFKKIEDGDTASTLFWLKTQVKGFNETTKIEIGNGEFNDEEISGAFDLFLTKLFAGGKQEDKDVIEGEVIKTISEEADQGETDE